MEMTKEMEGIITHEWMKETIKQLLIFHWKVPELLDHERLNRIVDQFCATTSTVSFESESEAMEQLAQVIEELILKEGIPRESLYWLECSQETNEDRGEPIPLNLKDEADWPF